MGGKVKKNNHFSKEARNQNWRSNCSTTARNLFSKDLGGVILGCTHHTIKECYAKKLFGLPRPHYAYVKKIEPSLPLFLFNYSDRKLHGVFEATSRGQMNIDTRAWTKETFEETPYPAQVKVRMRIDCQPLLEEQFQPVIISNYYSTTHFWFELDQEQTTKLIRLFSSNRTDATIPRAKYPDRQITLENDLLALNRTIGGERTDTPSIGWDLVQPNQVNGNQRSNESPRSEKEINEFAVPEQDEAEQNQSFASANKSRTKLWSSLFRSDSTSDAGEQPQSFKSLAPEVKGFDDLTLEETDDKAGFAAEVGVFASGQCDPEGSVPAAVCIDASTGPPSAERKEEFEEHASSEPSYEGAQEACIHRRGASSTSHATSDYDEFKVVDAETKFSPFDYSSMKGDATVVAPNFNGKSHMFQKSLIPYEPTSSSGSSATMITTEIARDNVEEGAEVLPLDVGVSEIVVKLIREVRGLKLCLSKQAQSIDFIEKQLRQEICCLKDTCKALKLSESSPVGPVGEAQYETGYEPRPFNKSIFIVGGYDGSSYLAASNLYSPHEDIMTSLSPMRFVRSQASVAKLRAELYVFGGVYDDVWHDTVEAYSQEYNKWTDRPSMNRRRGSLVGVSWKDKIFAIGGGADCEPFLDVEMYDPDTEKWIPTCSMLCKRLAPAAAELNGILYAVGGYDGEDYLKSAERFDPRECSWRPIKGMSTKRGGHSLVVLNQKLYAVGGYDGSRMVATVEVFDPCAGSWMMVESMNEAKANHGVVVIGDIIYSLGGLDEDMRVLDTVECYKEGVGWWEIDLKAFGKRCCFSAIVV